MPRSSSTINDAPAVRVLLFLPALVVLLAMAIGCGGSSSDTLKPEPFPTGETPLELLKHSQSVMNTLGTFRAQMDMNGTVIGEKLSISMDMEVSDNQWIHTEMSIDAPDGELRVEQVLTRQYAYTRAPSEDTEWIRVDLGALAESAALPSQFFTDPTGFYGSLFPEEDVPWEVYSVESIGRERIKGVETEHLRIALDFQELWAALDPEQQQQLGPLFDAAEPGLSMEEQLNQIEYERLEMWIDDAGYVRRMKMDFSMGDTVSVDMDMTMFDFGERIDIKEPDDYFDLTGQ